jgi:hypothetical protein
MSYSSTFNTSGITKRLCVEYIGEAFSLEISIQDDMGKRVQFVRIPLDDFEYNDLCMFSAFIQNCIATTDAEEIDFMNGMPQEDDDEEETV